jgi:hypothetical protein
LADLKDVRNYLHYFKIRKQFRDAKHYLSTKEWVEVEIEEWIANPMFPMVEPVVVPATSITFTSEDIQKILNQDQVFHRIKSCVIVYLGDNLARWLHYHCLE